MKIQSVFRIIFSLFIISIFLLEFPGVKDLIENPYSGLETQNLIVKNIDASGPNAAKSIVYGDEIYSIDGKRVRNYNHYQFLLSSNASFHSQSYLFQRGDKLVPVTVDYVPVPGRVIEKKFKYLLVAFTFLVMGVLVFIRRSDLLATLFSSNCGILAFLLTDRPAVSMPFLQLFGELFHDAIILLFPALFMHFFLLFPDRYLPDGSPRGNRFIWRIYWPFLLIYGFNCYLVFRHFFYSPAEQVLVTVVLFSSTVYLVGYVVASLVIFIRNYRSSPIAQKTRLRIVIIGTIAGIVPFLFTIVLRQVSPGVSNWWDYFTAVALGFVAVSFAYAILKHGAIELNLVIKKSLVYAVLTGAIIAVYYSIVNILGDYFTKEFNLSSSIFSLLSVLIIAVVFSPARNFFQRLIDRLFYVGEYVYKQEVVEFNKQLSGKLSRKEIFEYLFERIDKVLKASYCAVYATQENGGLELHQAHGECASLPREIPAECRLVQNILRFDKTLLVEYLDRSWKRRYLDEPSIEFLNDSKAAVILRLATHGSFMGSIILGQKRSKMLYKRTDAELLQTFIERLGLVLDNAALHEAAIAQERLKNEVMLARDIQLSLLPKTPPRLESFDILGKMMSSSEVGGDYFDYFMLDGTRAAIVLGDVSGNGIPAAMLMFSIQAVFKNLAIKEQLSPGELNRDLNNYLCDNAKPGQFATFFYAILDTQRSAFTFSNAGQHPALLVKEHYVDHLGEGGMLLGVERDHIYQEGLVRIETGDLICLHTDGIVEQTNRKGEEFGEERLTDLLRESKDLPLPKLTESLFASVLAFADGIENDDMSCIIITNKKR